jgi:hypothetical protein
LGPLQEPQEFEFKGVTSDCKERRIFTDKSIRCVRDEMNNGQKQEGIVAFEGLINKKLLSL